MTVENAPVRESDAQPRVPLLADDIWDMPDDGQRYEVVDGRLYVTTAPDLDHQLQSMNLSGAIWAYLQKHPLGTVVTAPVGMITMDFSRTLCTSPGSANTSSRGGAFEGYRIWWSRSFLLARRTPIVESRCVAMPPRACLISGSLRLRLAHWRSIGS